MITPEQLAEIKARMNKPPIGWEGVTNLLADSLTLLKELDRLHDAIKAKDAVLAQFSDGENWHDVDTNQWLWALSFSPIDLANQALNEGHE